MPDEPSTHAIDPIPPGPRLIPYLCVPKADEAIAFYQEVFGFEEVVRLSMKDGRIGHAELGLEGVRLFVSDPFPEIDVVEPTALKGTPVGLTLFVPDVDAVVPRAVRAGAILEGPVRDEFFGARSAKLYDPFGHRWMLQSRTHDISVEELKRRFEQTLR